MLRCGRNFKRFCYHLFVTLVGTRPAPEGVGAKAITHETGKFKTCVWLWRKRLASGRFGRLLRDKTRRSRIAKLHSAIEERVVVLTMEAPLARPAIGPAQSWPNRLASGSVGRARVEPPHMSPSFWNRDRAKHVAHCPRSSFASSMRSNARFRPERPSVRSSTITRLTSIPPWGTARRSDAAGATGFLPLCGNPQPLRSARNDVVLSAPCAYEFVIIEGGRT